MRRAVGKCSDNVFKCAVEGLRVVERDIEEAICEFSAMRADLVDTDCETSEAAIEHEQDVGAVATCARVVCVLAISVSAVNLQSLLYEDVLTWVEEFLRGANAISDRLIAELNASHGRRQVCSK